MRVFHPDGQLAVPHQISFAGHIHGSVQRRCQSKGDTVRICTDVQMFDIVFRYPLQPHRLPDATDGSIPHPAPAKGLLPVGQSRVPQVIPDPDHQLVFRGYRVGDIGGEGCITAPMVADMNLVYINVRNLICRTHMQQQPPVLLFQGELSAIEQV